MAQEQNVKQFDEDVDKFGSYVYAVGDRYSASVATERQTVAIVQLLERYFPGPLRILDVGCGDGTFTAELAERLPRTTIVGFDAAQKAVERAQSRFETTGSRMKFQVASAYEIDKAFAGREFDVAVVRGLLHHLYEVRTAIDSLSKSVNSVLILEPNGANPIMKAIERFSAYHRAHEEKSYWPPALNEWFAAAGYSLVKQQFVCVVPYFCPDWMAKILKLVEPVVERIPLLRFLLCGTNVAVYQKATAK